jgi:putative transposase
MTVAREKIVPVFGSEKLSKRELAKKLGVSRSSLYYQKKRPAQDLEIKNQIDSVMTDNPSYGHKRIALDLKLNKKRILRVMKLFNLKPARRRVICPFRPEDQKKPSARFENLIKNITALFPGHIFAADFTYIKYHGAFIYLATIIDLFTREIVGFNISRYRNKYLVIGALQNALYHNPPPVLLHSDQGSEYEANEYIKIAIQNKIKVSMSRKSSPWENGFQESFYSHFKLDLGQTNRFDTLSELVEAIYQQIFYYNNKRIHGKLKMPPVKFKAQYCLQNNSSQAVDKSVQRMGYLTNTPATITRQFFWRCCVSTAFRVATPISSTPKRVVIPQLRN